METCSVVLIFESVKEILWCDHSNETSSAVLLHGISIFYKMKFGIFLGNYHVITIFPPFFMFAVCRLQRDECCFHVRKQCDFDCFDI